MFQSDDASTPNIRRTNNKGIFLSTQPKASVSHSTTLRRSTTMLSRHFLWVLLLLLSGLVLYVWHPDAIVFFSATDRPNAGSAPPQPGADRCRHDARETSTATCDCPDPAHASYAFRMGEALGAWLRRHTLYLNDIAYQNLQEEETEEAPLDIALLGDSIVEYWNGTRGIGAVGAAEYRASFASFFDRRSTPAPFQGLALGTSGDITTELLWHVRNGLVTDSKNQRTQLQPKVWFVLIGTNDLGRMDCSKRTTLEGILHVLQYIAQNAGPTELLVHGLLPRADTYQQQNYTLGYYWQDILWINQQLRDFCDMHNCWYMEAHDLFLTTVTTGEGEVVLTINPRTMSDSLHPDLDGYNQWGPRIVQKVQEILARKD